MLISLSENEALAESSLFPHRPGNVTYFAPEEQIDFAELSALGSKGQFLMVVYVAKTTLYIMQNRDPHVHALKQLGYAFGDRLRDNIHPIIHR